MDRFNYEPELVEEGYRGFNLVRYRQEYYALAQSLGPLDLQKVDEASLKRLQQSRHCVIGKSLDEAKQILNQNFFPDTLLFSTAPINERPSASRAGFQQIKSLLSRAISDSLPDRGSVKNLQYLIDSLTSREIRDLSASLPRLNHLKDVLVKLIRLQRDRIKKTIDPTKKTVAVYFPSPGYREQVGDIAKRLRQKGYNSLTLIGTVCGDRYEKDEDVFYAGHDIINHLDFLDIFICPTLMQTPPAAKKRVYFLHDIHDSPLGNRDEMKVISEGLLNYDYIFVPSQPVIDLFAKVIPLARKNFPGRRIGLIKGGYIKLDRCLAYFEKNKKESKVIIYAPTVLGHGLNPFSSLVPHGAEIIRTLITRFPDHNLIFRPHPHTLHSEVVKNIVVQFEQHPKFSLDDNASFYMENYSKSALMVTDISGTAFTYAFSTLRPVVFFSPSDEELSRTHSESRYVGDREKIGCVARNLGEMAEKTNWLLENKDRFVERIREFRNSTIFNLGHAEDYFIENIESILEDKTKEDWVYL